MERPALQQLLADIQAGKVDVVVCYKVDRLTRSKPDPRRRHRPTIGLRGSLGQ
jgi:DNA invertase Pin-like site-specific DNA recombinase